MLLITWMAPAVRAMRVAEPLCCATLVRALPGNHTALHLETEAVLTDLRFGQLRSDSWRRFEHRLPCRPAELPEWNWNPVAPPEGWKRHKQQRQQQTKGEQTSHQKPLLSRAMRGVRHQIEKSHPILRRVAGGRCALSRAHRAIGARCARLCPSAQGDWCARCARLYRTCNASCATSTWTRSSSPLRNCSTRH